MQLLATFVPVKFALIRQLKRGKCSALRLNLGLVNHVGFSQFVLLR